MPLRLAIFDLDGTLKQAPDPYVYLHGRLGTWEAAQAITAKGLAGDLAYEEWLRLDAALWKGISRSMIEAALRENPYLPGAQDTIQALKQAGVWVAVVSTGLSLQAEQVQADLAVDSIFANEILFHEGRATGEARCLVPEGGKGPILDRLQAELRVGPTECMAVGDGDSDVDMFARVRVGVAVGPTSEAVRAAATLVLPSRDLRPLLPRLRALLPGWVPA
jgi:phosphoserine phosphatase